MSEEELREIIRTRVAWYKYQAGRLERELERAPDTMWLRGILLDLAAQGELGRSELQRLLGGSP